MIVRQLRGTLTLIATGLLAATAGCAATRPQPVVGNVTAADCYRPLEQGIRDVVSIWDNSQKTIEFRDWLVATRQEREQLERSGGANATIGFKGFSFGGGAQWSLKTLKELDARFQRDTNYRLTEMQAKGLFAETANETMVKDYFKCLRDLMNTPAAPVVLGELGTGESEVTFSLKVNPDSSGRTRNVRINKIVAIGGRVQSGSVQEGGTLSSDRDAAIIGVLREARPDGSQPGVTLWVFTDVRDVVAMVSATPTRQTVGPDPSTPLPVTDPKRRPLSTGKDRQFSTVAGESRGRSIDAIAPPGQRISQIKFWFDDQVIKGMEVFTPQGSLGAIGGFEARYTTALFALDEDEYLTQVQAECGRYIDWMKLWTNKKQSSEIGGRADRNDPMPTLMAGGDRKIIGFKIWSTHHDIEGIQLVTEPLEP